MSDVNESNTSACNTNAKESDENKNSNDNENNGIILKPAIVTRTLSRNNSLLLRRNTTIGLDGAALPSAFYCPLTLSVMRNPVIDREGNSYEKYAIEHWLSNHCTSPITRKPLRYKDLSPNRSLKEAIIERMGSTWLEENSISLGKVDSTTFVNDNSHDDSMYRSETPMNENDNMNAVMNSLFTEPKRIISSFLNHISNALGKNIELDPSGICAFTYEAFMIVIEVPEGMRSFFIYTELPGLLDNDLTYLNANDVSKNTCSELNTQNSDPLSKKAKDYQIRLMAKMLQLNYLQQDTLGGCLSLDSPTNTKVIFSYTDRVDEIDAAEFRNILENFIDSAMKLYTILKEIKDQHS